MKKFDETTSEDQQRLLLERAKMALGKWHLADAEISWLAFTHNAVFSVKLDDLEFILRISLRNKREPSNLELISGESKVLDGLEQKHIAAPIMVFYSRENEYTIALFEKVEGVEKTSLEVSASDIESIGAYLANLHLCDFTNFQKHHRIKRPSLDYDGLFSNNGLYPLKRSSEILFSVQQRNVMNTVAIVVKSAMDELGQGEAEFGLIHGDLLLKNILFHEGEVRALDFEYCGWGYYLYDLCPLLWQLKPLPNYKELEEALWNGYCSIRPLTERHRQLLETFIAARQVASMRWVAANQHNPAYQGKVESILQQRTAELQGFLETGILTRS